jgi:hypothetical protein
MQVRLMKLTKYFFSLNFFFSVYSCSSYLVKKKNSFVLICSTKSATSVSLSSEFYLKNKKEFLSKKKLEKMMAIFFAIIERKQQLIRA